MYYRFILEQLVANNKLTLSDICDIVNKFLTGRDIDTDDIENFFTVLNKVFDIPIKVELSQKSEYRFNNSNSNQIIEPINYLKVQIDNGVLTYQETEQGLQLIS